MRSNNILVIIFVLIILSYSIMVVVNANFGVIDDHGLLDTILIGKKLPPFIYPEIGRFFPLNGFELNILSIISKSPSLYYMYNAFQFIILCYLLYKIYATVILNKYIAIFSILSIIFNPGFVTAWFRLFVPERNVFLFLVVFLYFFLKFQKDQKIIYLIIGLISANIALYYKEPVFLILGGFAFFHLLFDWKNLNTKQKIFDFLTIISSSVFLIVYYFVVYINRGPILYGTTSINPLIQLVKIAFSYTLSDPILLFLCLPLGLWRLYAIIKSKDIIPIFDTMLFSSLIYVAVFFKLNMFAPYYLLPAYAFGLVPVVYFIFQREMYKRLAFKILLVVALVFTVTISLPTSLHFISHYKNVPNNFQKTLSFLVEYIKEKSAGGERVSIFLYGVNRNTGVEVYHSFIKYLEFYGLNASQFDFKSDEDDNGVLPFADNSVEQSKYTVWRTKYAYKIEKGDLLVVTPYTAKYIDLHKKEIESLEQDYELLYHAKSFIEIPNIGLKSIIKELARKYNPSLKEKKAILSENIYGLPIDFYVFRKK